MQYFYLQAMKLFVTPVRPSKTKNDRKGKADPGNTNYQLFFIKQP